jgi:hypothetical protein
MRHPTGRGWSGRGGHNGVGPSLKILTILGDRRSQFVSPRMGAPLGSRVTD